ncbi:MAG: hypothetical protein HRF49_10865 [bacterium]
MASVIALGVGGCKKGSQLSYGGSFNPATAPSDNHRTTSSVTGPGGDEFIFEPLDGDGSDDPKGGDAYKLALHEGKDGNLVLDISTNEDGEWKYVLGYVYYDPDKYNPVGFEKGEMFGEDDSQLQVAPVYVLKGKFAFWIGMLNFDEKQPKGQGSICSIEFDDSPWEPPKGPSIAPDDAGDAVFDLDDADVPYNNRTLVWGEVNRGDGDRNGEVGISDLTPLANYDDDTIAQWPMKDPVDYDDSGTIEAYPSGDYNVWLEAYGDGEAVDGYKIYFRSSYFGQVVHTVTVPGPDSSLRSSKFTYTESPEPEIEDPEYFYPGGFVWTVNGAVGYVCYLDKDDSSNEISDGLWWVSVAPYDGQNVGTESAKSQFEFEELIDCDMLYIKSTSEEEGTIDPGDTLRVQIWIERNGNYFYHMPACRLRIYQTEDSGIIDWDSVTFRDFSGPNPRPFCQDLYDQGCDVLSYLIGWIPPLRDEADDRTADINISFYNPTPSYGVAIGTSGYVGYVDIPTNTGTSGDITVQLQEFDPDPPYTCNCWYLFGNDCQNDKEYFDLIDAYGFQIGVGS